MLKYLQYLVSSPSLFRPLSLSLSSTLYLSLSVLAIKYKFIPVSLTLSSRRAASRLASYLPSIRSACSPFCPTPLYHTCSPPAALLLLLPLPLAQALSIFCCLHRSPSASCLAFQHCHDFSPYSFLHPSTTAPTLYLQPLF